MLSTCWHWQHDFSKYCCGGNKYFSPFLSHNFKHLLKWRKEVSPWKYDLLLGLILVGKQSCQMFLVAGHRVRVHSVGIFGHCSSYIFHKFSKLSLSYTKLQLSLQVSYHSLYWCHQNSPFVNILPQSSLTYEGHLEILEVLHWGQ